MARDLTAIRMSGELVEGLKRISAVPGGFYSERSVNWLISQAVKEFLERNGAPVRKDSQAEEHGPKRKGKG